MRTPKRHPGGRPCKASGDLRKRREIWLSDAEWAHAQGRASAVGMGASPWCRHIIMGRHHGLAVPAINQEAWSELSRVGGNLNQITRAINGGDVSVGVELAIAVKSLAGHVAALRMQLIGVDAADDGDDR